jgi:hypothetical protein
MPYGMKFYQKGGQKQKGGNVWFQDTRKSWGF